MCWMFRCLGQAVARRHGLSQYEDVGARVAVAANTAALAKQARDGIRVFPLAFESYWRLSDDGHVVLSWVARLSAA